MKTAFVTPGDHKLSIMQRIHDGTLAVNTPEEVKDVLAIYPDDPFLHRKHADLLVRSKQHHQAAQSYETASKFFIARGMNLQAVVAKILQWTINKPNHAQGRAFQSLLHEEGSTQTPLQRFWARMSYVELIAVMRRLVRIRYSAGSTIIRADDPAVELFFVVSGTLYEMPSPECESEAKLAGIEVEPTLLGPNDIFGDVFPLTRATVTDAEIRTATDVELVKITKPVLHGVCEKYPRIESVLKQIRKPENREHCDRPWQSVRRTMRFGVPTKAEITCSPPGAQMNKWRHTGIAVDLSVGGMCVDLADAPLPDPKKGLKGRIVQIKLDLLNDVAVLELSGKVAWQSRRNKQGKVSTFIGIRFDTLSALNHEMLTDYCSGTVGEENLLWSLWDTMVKTDGID